MLVQYQRRATEPSRDAPDSAPVFANGSDCSPTIPEGPEWQYEPKWDGFRCLAFRDGETVKLQSKAGQPLERYFPELVEQFLALPPARFVLDGEIVVPVNGDLSFDDLLQRIHPAPSRIAKLSAETPATYIVFDLLVTERGTSLAKSPLSERRERLEKFAAKYFKPARASGSRRRHPNCRS